MNISGELPLFIGSSQEEINRYKPAIIGQCDASKRLVYSTDKIVDIHAEDMTREQAIEFYVYNILGAYMGE